MFNNIVFIKHSDCINEYSVIYQNGSEQIFDGQEPYVKTIIEYLKNHTDYKLTIVSFGVKNRRLCPKNNIELNVIDVFSGKRIMRILKIIRAQVILIRFLFKKRANKIIYIADLNYLPAVILYSLIMRRKINLFLTTSVEKNYSLNIVIVLFQYLFNIIISRNKKNIQILHTLGYRKEYGFFYPRYVNISKSYIVSTSLRKDRMFKILFIGRLGIVKGIKVLQNIVLGMKNKNVSFYIIGNGPYYSDLDNLKQKHKINNLHLLGYIPNSNIFSYIHDADIGIIPSISEGGCKVAWEFMLMETPVIASNVGGIPEIIEDGVNGFLVASYDVLGFIHRIEQLESNQELLRNFARGSIMAKEKILSSTDDFSSYLAKILL